MYRNRIVDKCGVVAYSNDVRYANPHDERDVMRLLRVDYSNWHQFETAKTWNFLIFLALILVVWYVNMIDELDQILQLADFSWNFPGQGTDHWHLDRVTSSASRTLRRISSTASRTLGRMSSRSGSSPTSSENLDENTADSIGEPIRENGKISVKEISGPHRVS